MKKNLNVTVVNGQFVISEISYEPVLKEIGSVSDSKSLAKYMKENGFKLVNLDDASKALLKQEMDAKRAEREAKSAEFQAKRENAKALREERKAKAIARKASRIEKLEKQLAALKS